MLDSELLSFKVQAQDDFGVKHVGIDWQGHRRAGRSSNPAKGERILAAGGNDKESLESAARSRPSRSASSRSRSVPRLRRGLLPGRERVYSPAYMFYVLNAEQHAIWVTEQLSKWHRQSLEVRDREMQLYETNKQLRALAAEELDRPETRRRIENQAAAERANGRRLSGLVGTGEDLVKQAMRNPEFGVGHLEKWAEMLQILKDIAGNRMPSVADLLKQAAQAPRWPAIASSQQDRDGGRSPVARSRASRAVPSPTPRSGKPSPQVVDRESSQQPPEE